VSQDKKKKKEKEERAQGVNQNNQCGKSLVGAGKSNVVWANF